MNNKMVSHTLIVCLLATLAQAEDRHFARVFKRVMPRVEQTVDVMDDGAHLPDKALFGKDKRDLQEDIDKLLDRAIDVLGLSEASELNDGISEAEAGIRKDRKALDELRRKRVSARDGALLGIEKLPFATTKKGYEERIAALEARIDERETGLREMKSGFREQLGSIGLELTEAQADQLLSTVEGDRFIAMTIAFDNVKRITVELEELMAASGEDPETAKRYYGMYVVLLKILDRVQGGYVEEIDSGHLPRLEAYEKEAASIIAEARKLEEKANAENRRHLHANIASAQTTLEAIELYREYLQKQREAVSGMNQRLGQDIATAENTYRTVTLSTNLAALLRQGLDHFDALTRLTPPGLVVFQNAAVESEFRRLTERMKAL